jgi:hypothetical protein
MRFQVFNPSNREIGGLTARVMRNRIIENSRQWQRRFSPNYSQKRANLV